jgi:hypothetical protein
MAADWAKIAGNERIEKIARGTVQFLSNNPDSKAAQVGAWFLVFNNVKDKATRQRAIQEIEKLGGKVIINPDGRAYAIPPKKD